MDRFHSINPFTKKESHSKNEIIAYKVLTILSWLLLVISSFYYTFNRPHDDHFARRRIWEQNRHFHTGFSLNSLITSIYWLVLFVLQLGYVWHLFAKNTDFVTAAASVGSHFIFSNLLLFGFVMLFVRSHFWYAELLLVINFFNLSSLYFRHSNHPRFIHIPVVSGPLAFVFVALYWNGAIMVNAEGLAGRILANIAIWGILVYGMFFLVTFKDYTMGYCLSILTAALGVGQFLRQIVAFQWIFAFTIMAVLFLCSTAIGIPGIFGKELTFRREVAVSEDRERAPLLEDN